MNRNQLQEKLLEETKYSKWYLSIIENAQKDNRVKLNKLNEDYIYYENHHILPESIFKEYKILKEHKWNSVLLTAKEHFIAHLCIWKHYKSLKYVYGERKMSRAIFGMNNRGKYNSKIYVHLKLNLTVSKETSLRLSEANRRRKGKINWSDEARENARQGQLGRKHSDENNRKKSESHKGKVKTKEHCENISKGLKGRKVPQEQVQRATKTRLARLDIPDKNGITPRQKKSKSMTGKILKIIEVYDDKGNLRFKSDATFGIFCEKYNLPQSLIRKSFANNSIINITNRNSKKGLYNEFDGWWAIEIQKDSIC